MPPITSPFLRSISNYMLTRQYSKRTVKTYLYWIKYFIIYHKKQHPNKMSEIEVQTFLAVDR